MATTKDRIEELARAHVAAEPLPTLPPVTAPAAPATPRSFPWRETGRWLVGRISGRWAFGAAMAWIVLVNLAIAVTPPPNGQILQDPWLLDAINWASFGLMLAALVGFAVRLRGAMLASLGAAFSAF